MAKKQKSRKKNFQPVILTNKDSNYRIVKRKNNPSQKKEKLIFKKYCPINRKHIIFKESKKERHLK